jgi:hypothetical protein
MRTAVQHDSVAHRAVLVRKVVAVGGKEGAPDRFPLDFVSETPSSSS